MVYLIALIIIAALAAFCFFSFLKSSNSGRLDISVFKGMFTFTFEKKSNPSDNEE